MPRRSKTLLLLVACLAATTFAATTFFIARAARKPSVQATQSSARRQTSKGSRNLLLRPEARQVSRALGKRFEALSRVRTTTTGNLTLGATRWPVTMVRKQNEGGEVIEVLLADRPFTWSPDEGIRTTGPELTDADRVLVERLVLDSPDQFVLAQLRGASYFTVAQNVRPNEAVDGYAGPAWTLVRVGEPQQGEQLGARSPWRIYYINSQTGLIDQVVSELNGQTIQAQIAAWTDNGGERSPAHITWSIDGQVIMDFRASGVLHTEQ